MHPTAADQGKIGDLPLLEDLSISTFSEYNECSGAERLTGKFLLLWAMPVLGGEENGVIWIILGHGKDFERFIECLGSEKSPVNFQ